MRALVKYEAGPGNVAVRDTPAPDLDPDGILIDVAYCGICGTDRHAFQGEFAGRVPRILGHEASGVVAGIGDRVHRPDLAVGDRVTFETDAYLCLTCEYCRTEEYQRCPNRLGIGTTTDGALADRIVMPERAVHKLPDAVSLKAAALTEPLAISVHAVIEQSPSLAGKVVIVTGPGAIGQLCAAVATQVGATVVLVGRSRHEAALARARERGVAHAVSSDEVDVARLVSELTGGYGADAAFECSGASMWPKALQPMLRKAGRLVLVAFFAEEPELDVDLIIQRELEVVGSRGKRASSYRTALRLMAAGRIDGESFIGAELPLEEWEQGLELVGKGVKVVFTIAGG